VTTSPKQIQKTTTVKKQLRENIEVRIPVFISPKKPNSKQKARAKEKDGIERVYMKRTNTARGRK
jgi:hypothetical protein